MIQINSVQASDQVALCMKAGLVPFIKGSPGIGKSAIVRKVADDYNLKLIDIRLAQCDPTDLLGFPHINEKTNRGSYVPMDMFPMEGDPLPLDAKGKKMAGWFIFMDEMNSADRGVQKAAYKLLLDRMVGNERLHKNVAMGAAGNLDTDGAIVEELSSALQSRLIHFHMISDPMVWLEWASNNGIDYRITDFIRSLPKYLNTFDPDKETSEPTYACERTWDFTSSIIKHVDPEDMACWPTLGGTLGESVAQMFKTHLKHYRELPTLEDIKQDPTIAKLPTAPGTLHALVGSCAVNAANDNIDPMMTYLDRIPLDFQVVCIREMRKRNREMIATKPVRNWMATNNTEIF
jgi:hypothetical protein